MLNYVMVQYYKYDIVDRRQFCSIIQLDVRGNTIDNLLRMRLTLPIAIN